MHIVLLSGGSGKRLWPLSNDVRSKQFLKIFQNASGACESMVQRVWRQLHTALPEAVFTVAAPDAQRSVLQNQLGSAMKICAEPCRRDTFPAVVLAAAYLHDVRKADPGEAVVFCPVDTYAQDSYFAHLRALHALAQSGAANLVYMGTAPTYPSEKYGYILPQTTEAVSAVRFFFEKPNAGDAAAYIRQGALWNGGVFACRLGYLLERARERFGTSDYTALLGRYDTLEACSFDYAVSEKEASRLVLRYTGEWRDIGTWNTLTEVMDQPGIGEAVLDADCENVHVLNEQPVPILCMGLKNVVVAASAQGILVSDKGQSSRIKPLVEHIDRRVMFAEKSWGTFRVLDAGEGSLTAKLTLTAGCGLRYHSHRFRDEVWTVLSGTGRAVLDGVERSVKPGDALSLPVGCRHTVFAETTLELIEVQTGSRIDAADKCCDEWKNTSK